LSAQAAICSSSQRSRGVKSVKVRLEA
jgi:hypothetical protein